MLTVVMVAAIASVTVSWILVYIADVPRGVIIPDQVLARTDPGIEDLVIALVAGAAGAYVQIHKTEASLLPGTSDTPIAAPGRRLASVLCIWT